MTNKYYYLRFQSIEESEVDPILDPLNRHMVSNRYGDPFKNSPVPSYNDIELTVEEFVDLLQYALRMRADKLQIDKKKK